MHQTTHIYPSFPHTMMTRSIHSVWMKVRAVERRLLLALMFYLALSIQPAAALDGDESFRFGGFPMDKDQWPSAGCPSEFIRNNSLPELSIQSRLMEAYEELTMEERTVYSVGISVTSNENNRAFGRLPLPNITFSVTHDGPQPQRISILNHTFVAEANQPFTVHSNMMGRAVFEVVANGEIHKPLFHVHPPWFDHEAQRISFAIDRDAMYELSRLSGTELYQLVSSNSSTGATNTTQSGSPKRISLKTANATAAALRQLLEPAVHGELEADGDEHRLNRLKKRSLDFHMHERRNGYHPMTDVVAHSRSHRDQTMLRTLATHRAPVKHWLLKFGDAESDEDGHAFFELDEESHDRHKRGLLRLQRLQKRDNFGTKLKQLGSAIKNMSKSVFVDGPRQLFGGKKNGTQVNSTDADQNDGDDDDMDTLMHRVANSHSLLVKHTPHGLEVTTVSQQNGTVHNNFVQGVKHVFSVIGGIFHKIKVGFQRFIQWLRASFDWDGILLNHRVLTSHFMKMVPFLKTQVTNQKTKLANDANQMVLALANFTEQATTLFFKGNLSSLADLMKIANNQLLNQMAANPNIDPLAHIDPNAAPSSTPNGNQINMQSAYMNDKFSNHLANVQFNIPETDKQSLTDIAKNAMSGLGNITMSSWSTYWVSLQNLANQVTTGSFSFRTLFATILQSFKVLAAILAEKLVQGILVAFEFLITLLDKILGSPIRIPFISALYEKKVVRGTGQFTIYDLISLMGSTHTTIWFRMTHKGQNILTEDEANVIIQTSNPEEYVNNLVTFGLQVPARNVTQLQYMYRKSVSYILGAGYSTSILFSVLAGQVAENVYALYFLRAPFEFMAIMCNYPWSWYTNTLSVVGLNFRFLAWFIQFIPFVPYLFSWTLEKHSTGPGWRMIGIVSLAFSAIFPIYSIINVWIKDLHLVHGGSVDGATMTDVTMKGLARLLIYVPRVFIFWSGVQNSVVYVLRTMMISGAVLQNVRLMTDMPVGAIYSV